MKPRLNVVLTRFRWDWSLFFASTCSATRCVKATFTRFHWKFILSNDQKSLFSWLHFKSQLKVLNFSMNQEFKWGWTKIFFRNLRALEIIAPTSQFTFSRFCARVPPRERGAALFFGWAREKTILRLTFAESVFPLILPAKHHRFRETENLSLVSN